MCDRARGASRGARGCGIVPGVQPGVHEGVGCEMRGRVRPARPGLNVNMCCVCVVTACGGGRQHAAGSGRCASVHGEYLGQ